VCRKSSATHEGAIGEKEQQRGSEGNRNEGSKSKETGDEETRENLKQNYSIRSAL
jgi:hypothetical protein